MQNSYMGIRGRIRDNACASQCEFPRGVCRVGVRVSSSCLVLRALCTRRPIPCQIRARSVAGTRASHVYVIRVYVCVCVCINVCLRAGKVRYNIPPLGCRRYGLAQLRVYEDAQRVSRRRVSMMHRASYARTRPVNAP